MKVTLCAATSIDGFIATVDGNTNWVKDWELFESACKDFGCIVMGRNTYEEGGSTFDGVEHLVLSASEQKSDHPNVTFATSPQEAIKVAEQKGFNRLLVIGGSKTNESFIKAGLVDTIIIDLHPLILSEGKRIFGDFAGSLELEQTESTPQSEGFTHIVYSVKDKGQAKL